MPSPQQSGRSTAPGAYVRERDALSVVGELVRELHPQRYRFIEIAPQSRIERDLGIDSLDFLDIVFAIDKEFGIKIPLEKWTQEVNEGKVSTEEYFVLKNLCAKIDELRAAKA